MRLAGEDMKSRYRMSDDFKRAIREVGKHQWTVRDYELWSEMLDAAIRNCKYLRHGGLFGQILRSSLVMVVMGIVWKLLELYAYGEVQPRAVDTIMMLLILPFIFKAVR